MFLSGDVVYVLSADPVRGDNNRGCHRIIGLVEWVQPGNPVRYIVRVIASTHPSKTVGDRYYGLCGDLMQRTTDWMRSA